MIHGIGTDIVSIPRIRKALERHGEAFARKILTDEEWQSFVHSGQKASFVAKRFAAKEAAAKAIGTGFQKGVSMRDIGVANDELGKPLLIFLGRAHELAETMGIGERFLSLSDEREHAVAFVTLMKRSD